MTNEDRDSTIYKSLRLMRVPADSKFSSPTTISGQKYQVISLLPTLQAGRPSPLRYRRRSQLLTRLLAPPPPKFSEEV